MRRVTTAVIETYAEIHRIEESESFPDAWR